MRFIESSISAITMIQTTKYSFRSVSNLSPNIDSGGMFSIPTVPPVSHFSCWKRMNAISPRPSVAMAR